MSEADKFLKEYTRIRVAAERGEEVHIYATARFVNQYIAPHLPFFGFPTYRLGGSPSRGEPFSPSATFAIPPRYLSPRNQSSRN